MSEPQPNVSDACIDRPEIKFRDGEDANQKPPEKRYTLRLSPEAAETLEWIASARGGVSAAEVIRRSLGTERLLLEEIKQGYSVVLEKSGHRTRELILR